MGKRANGEGTVYQRKKDGRWVASIPLDNGKRKYLYCKTQKEAVKVLRQASFELSQGTLITEDQTLNVFLQDWLHNTAKSYLRPRSYQCYGDVIRIHILPHLGKSKLQKLSPQQVQRLYASKREQGYAPKTVRQIHVVLHRALKDAARWGLVTRNVCDLVEAPRVVRKEMVVWTQEQARHFLQTVKGDRLETLYILALTTGMRQGELLALKWSDIDFTTGSLLVQRTVLRVTGNDLIVAEPKTQKSRRRIDLTPLALESLKWHRLRQQEMRLRAGSAWADQRWIFCTRKGGLISQPNLLKNSFLPLITKAGLPRIRFHDLRHTAATLLLALGVHPKIVQELLGHNSISMTLDVYSHVIPTMQAEAVNRLQALLVAQG